MKRLLLLVTLFYSFLANSQTNNFHDTQGKLDISNSGQATYTLPIAMPPSLKSVGPVINIIYQSGNFGGIAGQGWNINSISVISRIASRRDIDGFQDGVDFDSTDKIALDGQRLLLVSGQYWADGSVYQTETQSNTKIELKGTGAGMYFIVTAPDGTRSWYGNYNGMDATDLTAFYINRYEDPTGNYITYHYTKPFNKSLCISEIKFSANTNGIAPLNSILFYYKQAQRIESAYIKGIKHEKVALLDNVQVKTNDQLFRKYVFTHVADTKLGYEKVSQIQEFNAAMEPANPIVFEYENTEMLSNGSEVLTTYYNNLSFEDIKLSGDFDGDGRLDFVTGDNNMHTKLFQGTSSAPIAFTYPPNNASGRFTATTIKNGKLNQFQSIVYYNNQLESTTFDIRNFSGVTGPLENAYNKTIAFPNSANCISNCPSNPCTSPTYLKDTNKYIEGDFNGDGISEVLIIGYNEYKEYTHETNPPTNPPINENLRIDPGYCRENYKKFKAPFIARILDLNPNSSTTLGTKGYVNLADFWNLGGDKHYAMDFDGDGKTDILAIYDNKTYKVLSFKELDQSPWTEIEVLGEGTLDQYSSTKQILFGDFNGDGKADIMLPQTEGKNPGESWWYVYFSNPKPAGGSFFEVDAYNIVEYWPDSETYFETGRQISSYYALDTNGDGKSDLVRIWRNQYKPAWTINDHDTNWKITSFANNIGKVGASGFSPDYVTPCVNYDNSCDHHSDSPNMVIPIVSSYRHQGLNKEIVLVRSHYNQLTYIDFMKDVSKDNLLKKVTSAGGAIVDEITYQTLEPTDNNSGYGNLNEFYSSTNSLNYPYIEIKRLPLTRTVSKLTNKALGITKHQDFKYHGFSVSMNGIGSLGFTKTARSSWYRTSSDKKTWSVIQNDPTKRGALASSYTLLENTTPFSFTSGNTIPSDAISSMANEYSITTTNGLYVPLLTKQTTINNLTSVKNEKTYQYLPVYNLPETVITKNFLGTTEQGKTTSVTEYENNPSGTASNYYIGRPKKTTTTTEAYNDSHAIEELYTYNPNGTLKKLQKKPIGETFYLTEELEYDTYGNIKKKTVSAPGAAEPVAPRITEYTYDTSARFVSESKDILGKITKYTYNPLYGVVLTETDHYNLTTTTTYDNWGKPTKVTDYLGKDLLYVYAKENGQYRTQLFKDDGGSSVSITNAIGQEIKKGTKLLNNQWSYTSIDYDYLGRKVKDNDNFVDLPFQWTSYTYDDYGRLIQSKLPTGKITDITYNGLSVTSNDGIKTSTVTKNANDHTISTTDNGGTINYKYYATGALKESDFEGVKITTEYDKWGRKTKLTDPSAGEYRYEYSAFGETRKEITPKGATSKFYDDFGRVTLSEEIATTGASYYTQYYYNFDHTFYGHIRENLQTGEVADEQYFEYDSFKRPTKTTQISPTATFVKELTYDAFGRIDKEKRTATVNASGKTSSKTFKYSYRSGYNNSVADDSNGKILWSNDNVNIKGQITNGSFGNGLYVNNYYNSYGFIEVSDTYKMVPNPNYGQGPLEPIETTQSTINLATTFHAQTGNLISRQNTLFNHSETFQYDSLDRLVKWDKEILTIHNNKFDQGTEDFVSKSGAGLSNQNGTLKVVVTPQYSGVKKVLLSQAKINEKLNIKVNVNKGTTAKVSIYIKEYNPWNGQSVQSFKTFANNTAVEFEHTVTQYPVIELHIEKVNGDFPTADYPTEFFVDDLLVVRHITENQDYDNRGRITQNTLGQYNYADPDKAYQNTSISLNPESGSYYANREGLFHDGMENQKGWSLKMGGGTVSFNDANSKSGRYSLKLSNPTANKLAAQLNKWIPIDNNVATQYTYSGWIYSDNPNAELVLVMQTADGSITQTDNVINSVKNSWTFVTKTFNVPANIKKISLRVDNNSTGTVWFDDVNIKKTANPVTALRLLDVTYDMFKKPVTITETGITKVDFKYNDNHFRSAMYYGGLENMDQRQFRKDYSADGTMEITTNQLTGESTFVFFVGGDAYSAPVVYKDNGTVKEYLYLHRDYQGTILAISNQAGNFVEKRLFDAWGNLLKVQDGQGNDLNGLTVLDRGYTGHEHIQSIGIINMNGRLYDPKLHRFLSPDNYIQDPYNTQNYNRYGYVLNNPLKYTDPTGEIAEIAVAMLIGAAVAATTYTLTALLADVPFTVGGIIQSAAIGAFSASVTFGIGQTATNICQFGARITFQSIMHGSFQGAMSGIQGGDIFSGFASGAIGSLAASFFSGGDSENALTGEGFRVKGLNDAIGGGNFGMIAFGSVSGGAGAALTGGNFWQGAATALVVGTVNHAMHSPEIEETNNDSHNPFKRFFADRLKQVGELPKSIKRFIYKKTYVALRATFDGMETLGGHMEVGAATATLVSGGLAAPEAAIVAEIGLYISIGGTFGNIAMDIYDGNYQSALYRGLVTLFTVGTGKAIEKYTTGIDKILLEIQSKFFEKAVVPKMDERFNRNYNRF